MFLNIHRDLPVVAHHFSLDIIRGRWYTLPTYVTSITSTSFNKNLIAALFHIDFYILIHWYTEACLKHYHLFTIAEVYTVVGLWVISVLLLLRDE